jgi:hypothetical protein
VGVPKSDNKGLTAVNPHLLLYDANNCLSKQQTLIKPTLDFCKILAGSLKVLRFSSECTTFEINIIIPNTDK